MDEILKHHERLENKDHLGKSLDEVDRILEHLKRARASVEADPTSSSASLAKLHGSVKGGFDKINDNLKGIHGGLGKYSKAVDKKFKERALPFQDDDDSGGSTETALLNRAIAMHLLREGHFDVAATFVRESHEQHERSGRGPGWLENDDSSADSPASSHHFKDPQSESGFAITPNASLPGELQDRFQEMYHILHELRHNFNLAPAISWAQEHSQVLDARGSNLEYDLCRLQYTILFHQQGAQAAIAYGRQTFGRFHQRYQPETMRLCGALAFLPNLQGSPYASQFSTDPNINDTHAQAAAAFTSEFCALLSLSSASPLLTAVTAGCIALPTLQKLNQIQQSARTSWTSVGELPVEIPLPMGYQFHSIFVCPVSKEQSTDSNPPMMLPCGHVVAQDSLNQLSRGARFKCPYCPAESHPRDATKIYF